MRRAVKLGRQRIADGYDYIVISTAMQQLGWKLVESLGSMQMGFARDSRYCYMWVGPAVTAISTAERVVSRLPYLGTKVHLGLEDEIESIAIRASPRMFRQRQVSYRVAKTAPRLHIR